MCILGGWFASLTSDISIADPQTSLLIKSFLIKIKDFSFRLVQVRPQWNSFDLVVILSKWSGQSVFFLIL